MTDMIIIIDTREQLPYNFDPIETVSQALKAGDYSIKGYESVIAVERKTIDDFVSSITHWRDRFMNEMAILAEYEQACIVVEANLRNTLTGEYRSQTHPNSVLGTSIAIELKYGVPVHFCSDRQAAQIWVKRYLSLFYQRRNSDG
jgi:ERCC4-type nuclease